MSWLKNRSIGAKLGILAGIPLMLLIAVACFNFYNFNQIDLEFEEAYVHYSVPATNMAIASINNQANMKNALKIVATGDPARIRTIENDIEARRSENETIFKSLDSIKLDSTGKELLNAIKVVAPKARAVQDNVVRLGSRGRADDEGIDLYFAEFEPIGLEYNDLLVRLMQHLNEGSRRVQQEAMNYSDTAAVTSMVVAGVAVLITLVMSFLIARYITKPINVMQENITKFAAGDLTISYQVTGQDALTQMGHAILRMAETLRGVINTIKDAGDQISSASQDFSAMAQQTNASVEEFRANVDEMNVNLSALASSSEEVNASVEEVAAGAQTTAEKGTDIARKVDNAMNAGDEGMNAVRSVVDGIGRVAESSAASTSAVLELGNRTRQIQNFVSQIGSIADQTNLLALNAAIEAARAGDAGRGFAVVAEEVRKLAEDSNVAAKNIADLATQITGDLDRIVKYAQENTEDSNKAKELSNQTEHAIDNMISYLRDIAASTQDLAAVAEEQAASSEEIAEAVQSMSTKVSDTAGASENIRTSVQEVAAASEKVAEGSESLSNLSGRLQEQLEYFNIGDAPSGKKGLKALPRR
ncbi:MAG: methyl-accepting chemotaxis protein [Synergistaceae bacterium]|jgi:methyl-accepting chemotaxis protein|nr:methyl-accepting chemotaxis protein [Synergistaceae bacterium]